MKLFLAVEKFRICLTNLGKAQAVDKIDDFLKRRLDNLLTATRGTKTQNRALPEILIPTFSNGDIKLVGYPRLDSPENSSLSFQGMVLWKNKANF